MCLLVNLFCFSTYVVVQYDKLKNGKREMQIVFASWLSLDENDANAYIVKYPNSLKTHDLYEEALKNPDVTYGKFKKFKAYLLYHTYLLEKANSKLNNYLIGLEPSSGDSDGSFLRTSTPTAGLRQPPPLDFPVPLHDLEDLKNLIISSFKIVTGKDKLININ